MIIGQDTTGMDPLPRVSLFVGPKSVGKRTTAEWLRWRNSISDSDVLRVYKLLVTEAVGVTDFASHKPTVGSRRLVIIDLDRSTTAAVNHLLKTIEEAPESTHFILTSSKPVLDTIKSRAVVFPFHLLSKEDVARVLEERKKFSSTQAKVWADRSNGTVRSALNSPDMQEAKPLIMLVVKAFRELDPVALEKAADKWKDDHTQYLVQWCHEAISGQWAVFNEDESGYVARSIPMKILMAARADVRPRLLVRANLMSALKGMMT